MHVNGIHPVEIYFCECDSMSDTGSHVQQLLRRELYPATTTDPTTCMTFRALEQFHGLTLQSKITIYDYYLSLNHLTDNTGVEVTWVSSRIETCWI